LFSYVDSEQRYRFINRNYENAHVLPQEQIIGKHVREVLGDSAYELAQEHIETVLSGQRVIYEAAFPLRSRMSWMTVTYVPDLDEDGKAKGFFTLVTDITDRKKAEEALRLSQEELRALAGQLISAKEEEAKRIARELHDEFGQRLALLNLKASEVVGLLSRRPEIAAEKLQTMSREIGSVAKAIHDLSRHLHPAVLSQLGLAMALESECAHHSQQDGLSVDFHSGSIPEQLPESTALCLYRVAQESLQNISKHAQANRARVIVDSRDNEIVLTVQDFGRGFDLDAVRGEGGLGLVSMEERVRMVGGTLSLYSKPGQGTKIEVCVPIGRART
jgi:PAS domain S-box-containing protein